MPCGSECGMKLIGLLLAVVLVGCDDMVPRAAFERGQHLCASHGGLVAVRDFTESRSWYWLKVICAENKIELSEDAAK